MNPLSTRPTLFEVANASMRAIVLSEDDIPCLQEFFVANPAYFLDVYGEPPRANEAYEEFHDLPPAEMTYTRRMHIGFVNDANELEGIAGVLSDFLAAGVWHIGLYVVATSLHGSGVARSIHAALEAWMKHEGAQWVRLGVVAGNARAERFWERSGYIDMRTREGVEMGKRINTVRVMVKPLCGGALASYLERVPRDRPG